MKDLISIIVPVYNTILYLETCLASIAIQTYRYLEVVLVDDGSNDGSSIICDKYVNADKRFKVFHIENHGQAYARNIALKNITGKYLCFVDSDDYIETNMIEKLYNCITEHEADIAVCDYYTLQNEIMSSLKKNEVKSYTSEGALFEVFKDGCIKTYLWNKIFKKELWDDMYFSEGRIFEDAAIVGSIISKSNSLVYIDEKLYFYRIHGTSTMNTYTFQRYKDELYAYREQYELAKKFCVRGIPWIEIKIAEIIRDMLDNNYISCKDNHCEMMKTIYKRNFIKIMCKDVYGLGIKFSVILILISINTYKTVRGIWKNEKCSILFW